VGRRIITGDIHGCFKTMKKLLKEQVQINREDTLYFVGDFIDRGPASREVLDFLIDLKWQGYTVIAVRGNHEDLMLKAFNDEGYMHAWFNNGAESTLSSFDIPEESIFEYESIRSIPNRYIQFLSNMKYFHEEEDFILVHAGLDFKLDDPFSDHQSMLWLRNFDYNSSKAKHKHIIHGHTPMPRIQIEKTLKDSGNKVINLDAGCVYKDLPGYGFLLAYDPDNQLLFFEKNIDEY